MDRALKKERKLQERVHKAEIIKKYQDEIERIKNIINNDKNLSMSQKEHLKKQIKDYKGYIFSTKHPFLDSARDLASALFECLDSLNDELYEHNYGGDGYTEEDKAEVRDAMNYFGPVAESRTRARIEERIKNEKQLGDE